MFISYEIFLSHWCIALKKGNAILGYIKQSNSSRESEVIGVLIIKSLRLGKDL